MGGIIVQVKEKSRWELGERGECGWTPPDAEKQVYGVNLQGCCPCPSEYAGGSAAAEPASPRGSCSLTRADLQAGPVATDPDSERCHFGAQPWQPQLIPLVVMVLDSDNLTFSKMFIVCLSVDQR